MNQRIQELMSKAGTDTSGKWMSTFNAERFAELIVGECISTVENAENGYEDYRSQIEDGMRNHCISLIKNKFGIKK